MRVVPAVDIRGGLCVNLVQGDYGRETVFGQDPAAQAVRWRDQGAELVHIVDLDGAKAGRCCVEEALAALTAAGVPFEVGGGIRKIETVRRVMELGARRVILGTAAYRRPDLVEQAAREFPGQVAVGIDARDGNVALCGWCETTNTGAVAFALRMEAAGAARIIFTDIGSDGMMSGPNIQATRTLARALSIPVTASGGISSLDDIRALRTFENDGIDEVIVGRALYVGAFGLPEALAAAREGP